MQARFPQPVRVGDLIGLPVLDDSASHARLCPRRSCERQQDKIELIVAYDGWFGWGTRPVAVPIEVVGIAGRQIASLDMPRKEYASAPTWQPSEAGAQAIPNDTTIRIALSRH